MKKSLFLLLLLFSCFQLADAQSTPTKGKSVDITLRIVHQGTNIPIDSAYVRRKVGNGWTDYQIANTKGILKKVKAVYGLETEYEITCPKFDIIFSDWASDFKGPARKVIKVDGTKKEVLVELYTYRCYGKEAKALGAAEKTTQMRNENYESREPESAKFGFELFSVPLAIDKELIKPNYRLVAQPIFYDVNDSLTFYGEPFAYYGDEYAKTEARLYDYEEANTERGLIYDRNLEVFGMKHYIPGLMPQGDPLYDVSMAYSDTLNYYRNGKLANDNKLHFYLPVIIKVTDRQVKTHDCTVLVKWLRTDYTHIIDSVHVDTIQEGRHNPIQFLDYGMDGGFLSPTVHDANVLFPAGEAGQHDDDRTLKLSFAVNSTVLDWDREGNQRQKRNLDAQFDLVRNNPNTETDYVLIHGYASPEGDYKHNLELAAGRASSLRNYIIGQLPQVNRNRFDIKPEVVGWDVVADTLRRNHKKADAERLEEYIKRGGNTSILIRTEDPTWYADVIEPALAAQRSINVALTYSITREDTDEEIIAYHEKNPKGMSLYQYYRLYRYYNSQNDYTQGEKVCQEGYEKALRDIADNREEIWAHLLFANDLAAYRIRRGVSASDILAPIYAQGRYNNGSKIVKVQDLVADNLIASYIIEEDYANANGLLINRYGEEPKPNESMSVRTLRALIGVQSDPDNEEYRQVLSEESPVNNIVLALHKCTPKQWEETLIFAEDRDVLADSVAINNLMRAFVRGTNYYKVNDTFKITDYNNQDLKVGAKNLAMALDQDPSLRERAFSQAYLKPIFKAMNRYKAEGEIVRSVVFTRNNALLSQPLPDF